MGLVVLMGLACKKRHSDRRVCPRTGDPGKASWKRRWRHAACVCARS
ncbi:hypothetical protein LNP25_01195 [Klebsiella variicola subsp. variicola]|nr:hypothetical protein [Klebsiella variicola subsp. variicola]